MCLDPSCQCLKARYRLGLIKHCDRSLSFPECFRAVKALRQSAFNLWDDPGINSLLTHLQAPRQNRESCHVMASISCWDTNTETQTVIVYKLLKPRWVSLHFTSEGINWTLLTRSLFEPSWIHFSFVFWLFFNHRVIDSINNQSHNQSILLWFMMINHPIVQTIWTLELQISENSNDTFYFWTILHFKPNIKVIVS